MLNLTSANIKELYFITFQIAKVAFKNTKLLNRIQTVVFETAYKTNENLLICAPTGAGKTNIAMLTILHEIKQHISQGVIKKDEFKVGVVFAYLNVLMQFSWLNFSIKLKLTVPKKCTTQNTLKPDIYLEVITLF
ncbi:hypothetical protein DPMN_053056 [Dreissena polymorpha]|uniref:DEAD/DEAH-box helicase domain-containing protein n=1 Tax=Dreissena polymorpha TaxID=45954 RepID=A0A9D4CN04_DREPO|nr:hypothetical protein DPMN_053056 [Dreissena polymorpha]